MEEQNQDKIDSVKQKIENLEKELENAKRLLAELSGEKEAEEINEKVKNGGKVIEGIFNGQSMTSSGKEYPVPANYASKSKLVEGDVLKLTITDDGSFIYKQIGPIDRERIIGRLVQQDNGQYVAITKDNRSFNVLLASVTYFKAKPNDEVTLVIPKNRPSSWAAIENVIKRTKPEPETKPEEPEKITKEQPESEEGETEKLEGEEENPILKEITPDLEEIKKEAKDETNKEPN